MVDLMLYLRKQRDNTFAFRVNVAKIKEDGNFFPNNNVSNLNSATVSINRLSDSKLSLWCLGAL
ncbi:hypothetical protein AAH113_21595, partial [Parabacteroides distasonis]